MHDLVIRNGLVVDGSGEPARRADVAVDGDRIAAVGDDIGPGRREIDAEGMLVTPGFVDIHTHYDGQVTWDPYLSPSGGHGVTTVVMGNCGVGFAPAAPDRRDWLIELMEAVEDIPGTALTEGMTWDWESFPDYLDSLDDMPRALDVAAQVPHGALRAYVMGDRGADNGEADAADIAEMGRLVREALEAGAVGFSTTRTVLHRTKTGELATGTTAAPDELVGIGLAMGEAGAGVFEMASDMFPPEPEFAWMTELSRESGRPITFNCLQNDVAPEQWRRLIELARESNEQGAHIVPQVAGRPACLMFGWESSAHPFLFSAAYGPLHGLPFDEKIAELRRPEVRDAICNDSSELDPMIAGILRRFDKIYPLGDPPDYEPSPDQAVTAIAEREGRTPEEVTYDLMLEADGHALLYMPLLGYSHGDFEALREMLDQPDTVLGLGDGGAHCGILCDASLPTYMLTHWVRDRDRGDRLPLEQVVRLQTRRTAEMYGFLDRGLLAPGFLADVNVVDFESLRVNAPRMVYDLPAGGRRIVQDADGYVATVKRGVVTYVDGEPTGELPGRLLRGAQPAPA